MYPEGEEREVLTFREERLIESLRKERAARKAAERKFKELWPKYKAKSDAAELWEYRSKKNLERLHTMTIKNATPTTERV